jgi:hypothetical protein
LQQDYLKFVDIDGKPEKGERKCADDFILLINEVADTGMLDELVYIASINEHALALSPDNFDINMHLCKIYEQLGMVLSF